MFLIIKRHVVICIAVCLAACVTVDSTHTPESNSNSLNTNQTSVTTEANKQIMSEASSNPISPNPITIPRTDKSTVVAAPLESNTHDDSPTINATASETESIDGVKLAATIRVLPAYYDKRLKVQVDEMLRVEYRVTNQSGKPILIFNQGDTRNPEAVYVEAKPEGIVEISERGWETPREPSPTVPVYPGAMLLAPNQSTTKKLDFTLAYLVAYRPYQSMTPGVEMPRNIKRVRYCLGFVPAEGIKTRTENKANKRIFIPEYKAIVTQRLLCSDVKDIQ